MPLQRSTAWCRSIRVLPSAFRCPRAEFQVCLCNRLQYSPGEAMHWIAPSEKDTDNAALEKRLWDSAEQLRLQIQNLRRTRDLLLPRLLSGKLRPFTRHLPRREEHELN